MYITLVYKNNTESDTNLHAHTQNSNTVIIHTKTETRTPLLGKQNFKGYCGDGIVEVKQ